MQTLVVAQAQSTAFTRYDDVSGSFTFNLSGRDQQHDVVYFDRPGEVHVNLALGRLCTIGCQECSATLLSRGKVGLLRGNLAPATIRQKVQSIVAQLKPMLNGRALVISTMNDGDPLTRPVDDLILVVNTIFDACEAQDVPLDHLNLSSSLVPIKYALVRTLADRYAAAFGTRRVQLQASLLATTVKQNIFAGDGSALVTMLQTLGAYRAQLRAATGHGEVWINYVAVRQGDFGRADNPTCLETIAKVAEPLLDLQPDIQLKITRGSVEGLAGWQQLNEGEYATFVAAVRQRWGDKINIYCPDLAAPTLDSHRCGRIQSLSDAS